MRTPSSCKKCSSDARRKRSSSWRQQRGWRLRGGHWTVRSPRTLARTLLLEPHWLETAPLPNTERAHGPIQDSDSGQDPGPWASPVASAVQLRLDCRPLNVQCRLSTVLDATANLKVARLPRASCSQCHGAAALARAEFNSHNLRVARGDPGLRSSCPVPAWQLRGRALRCCVHGTPPGRLNCPPGQAGNVTVTVVDTSVEYP
jgi:hypothetical protein